MKNWNKHWTIQTLSVSTNSPQSIEYSLSSFKCFAEAKHVNVENVSNGEVDKLMTEFYAVAALCETLLRWVAHALCITNTWFGHSMPLWTFAVNCSKSVFSDMTTSFKWLLSNKSVMNLVVLYMQTLFLHLTWSMEKIISYFSCVIWTLLYVKSQ